MSAVYKMPATPCRGDGCEDTACHCQLCGEVVPLNELNTCETCEAAYARAGKPSMMVAIAASVTALLRRAILVDTMGRGDLPSFESFTGAMRPAEELGGPEGADYVALMRTLCDDAKAAWCLVPPQSDAGRLIERVRSEAATRLARASS